MTNDEASSQNAFTPILKAAQVLARAETEPAFKARLHSETQYLATITEYGLHILPFPERIRVVVSSAKTLKAREQLLDFLTPEWPAPTGDVVLKACPRGCIGENQLLKISDKLLRLNAQPKEIVALDLAEWGRSQNFNIQEATQLAVIISQL